MGKSIDDLGWLTGCWQGKHNSEDVDEIWSAPKGNTMVGTFRQFVGTELTLYEIIVIELIDDDIMMRVKHFGPELAAWEGKDESQIFRLDELKERDANFMMQGIPGSEVSIRYIRKEDELTVTLTKKAEETSTETYTFNFSTLP